MPKRVLFAGFFHETHSFVDEVTRWSDFVVARDDEIPARRGDRSVTDGFLAEAVRQEIEVVPTIDAWALPGGTVEDAAFETFWREFVARARPALAAGADGIFLVLHGAMVTPSLADPEGELLARIRMLPGAATIPIFGVLDLHATVTAAMCRCANGLLAYRENPHTDARETAVRATALLARCLREQHVPHMSWCRPPLLWTPPAAGTQTDPMRSLEAFARRSEAGHADIWACNVVAGFSFADTPDTGMSLSVVSVAPPEIDRRVLEAGAQLAWSLRAHGHAPCPTADEVCRSYAATWSRAREQVGPVLLVEPSDNIGGGAPGDGTGVLRALLQHRIEGALVVINDPWAVAALADLASGQTRRLAVGGRGSRLDEGPVSIEATLVSRSDGAFTVEDANSHLVAMSGAHYAMGPCAVVRSGGVTILLTSRKTPPFDLAQLRSQGLEPRDFTVIGVKAAVAHRRAYDPIASAAHYVDTPGPCTNNLGALPWRRLKRPVWPIEPLENFTCQFA